MKGDYPRFRASYLHEELVEHFHLEDADHDFVGQFRGDANRNTVAVLLKSLLYLGYFPERLDLMPEEARVFIANQLNLLWDCTSHYQWESSTKDYHLSVIRQHTGWRFPTAQDKQELERWLRDEGTLSAHTEEDLLEAAYDRFRNLRMELPAGNELRRIVNAALNGFFQELYTRISSCLSLQVRANLDQLCS